MVKLDPLFLLFAYLLRMTQLLLFNLVIPNSSYVYNYWFHSTDNARMRNDVTTWMLHITYRLLLELIYGMYFIVQCPLNVLQLTIRVVLWWPKFYLDLIRDPGGRSLFEMFTDPRFRGSIKRTKPSISRVTRRQFLEKGKVKIQPLHAKQNIFTSYQVQGAFAHFGQNENQKLMNAITTATNYIHFDDPLRLSVPYEYIAKRIPEPPDNDFMKMMACSSIIGIYAVIFTLSCFLILKHRVVSVAKALEMNLGCIDDLDSNPIPNSKGDLSTRKVHAYTASREGESSDTSTFDSDGVTFVIDNSANCIICNDRTLFVGELTSQRTEVNTSNGINSPQWKGTLRVQFTDDNGETTQYDLPEVVFDPNSPFNIMGIPELGRFFGRQEGVPDNDEDGTWIKSSATKSVFTWDNGTHTRTFYHSERRLPELVLGTGFSYFSSFCTRVRRHYDDNVQYAFSSAYTVIDPETPDTPAVISPIKEYALGSPLVYKDGKGNHEAVVYEGVSADGNRHIVRTSDGAKVVTPESHIQDMNQADLTNVPTTPLEYCQEIGKGLTKEEVQSLVYPRVLSPLQQEFMSWHHRLYHLPFNRMLLLARKGYLPKRLLKCQDKPPKCIACQFGTAHRRPWRVKGKKSGSIRKENEKKPGDGTSIDQIVSAQPGLIPQMAGFLTNERLWGTTTFVDHVSDFVYVHLMKNFTLEETLKAKRAYEKLLHDAGHTAKHYRADNGRFADSGFHKDITDHDQTIDFCGVGAHNQNGIVENKNRQLTLGARTLLLHGMRYWPQIINSMFWPFAIKAYSERMNRLHIDLEGSTPEMKFYGMERSDIPLQHYHTLFCPVYVLDARLQSAGGAGPPKWEPRSRIGVYLGHSPFHAGSVALVFNPLTGRVSPQFHVVFDDDFTTVPFMVKGETPPNWEDLCKHSFESSTDEAVDQAMDWLAGQDDGVATGRDNTASTAPMMGSPGQRITDPFAPLPDQQDVNSANNGNATSTLHGNSEGERDHLSQRSSTKRVRDASDDMIRRKRVAAEVGAGSRRNLLGEFDTVATAQEQVTDNANPSSSAASSNELLMPQCINLQEAGLRRSSRVQEQEKKKSCAHVTFGTHHNKNISLFALLCTVGNRTMPYHPIDNSSTYLERVMNRMDEANELVDGTLNKIDYLCFTADVSKNETFTYHDAMKQKDKAYFVAAMEKEILDHETRGHWTLQSRSVIPSGTKAIKAIWSFKRKRFPDGRLNKHKARICAHGGMQQWGENYWETYSPVVNAMTVKLLLIIAKLHKLESKSIDFVLAFPQADLDIDIWMDLPMGFQPVGIPAEHANRYVLKLNKNLYGLKQASYNWYEKLKTGLEEREFEPSDIDPCLYFNKAKDLAVLTYVDDCIIVGKSKANIDAFVYSMIHGPEKFDLTDEGTIDKFLGIEITQRENGEFEMSQPFLIDRILSLLDLDNNTGDDTNINGKLTPAAAQVLNKDLSGKPRKREWAYRTAVGMLSYLQANTRPDISMAVHQTARFCNNPMLSHEQAIMRIGRYLRHTKNRGIIFKPDETKGLECFVDADFAGGWNQADADDAENLMSRTGYVIKYANCPIHWSSKLQTEIALSTAESEYIALSQSLREVIPLMTLMLEINKVFPLHIDLPNFYCRVWEDNQSCIAMTQKQKFSPRTKHIALKYHHFREFVKGPNPKIRVAYVHTESQEADIFTKPVKDHLFPKLRYLLLGW